MLLAAFVASFSFFSNSASRASLTTRASLMFSLLHAGLSWCTPVHRFDLLHAIFSFTHSLMTTTRFFPSGMDAEQDSLLFDRQCEDQDRIQCLSLDATVSRFSELIRRIAEFPDRFILLQRPLISVVLSSCTDSLFSLLCFSLGAVLSRCPTTLSKKWWRSRTRTWSPCFWKASPFS